MSKRFKIEIDVEVIDDFDATMILVAAGMQIRYNGAAIKGYSVASEGKTVMRRSDEAADNEVNFHKRRAGLGVIEARERNLLLFQLEKIIALSYGHKNRRADRKIVPGIDAGSKEYWEIRWKDLELDERH